MHQPAEPQAGFEGRAGDDFFARRGVSGKASDRAWEHQAKPEVPTGPFKSDRGSAVQLDTPWSPCPDTSVAGSVGINSEYGRVLLT